MSSSGGHVYYRRALIALLAAAVVGCATTSPGGPGARERNGRRALPAARGPYDIAYTIAMPDTLGHHFEVTIDVGGISEDTLRLQMPVWSPGRYARMDFARNVRGFTVTDTAGKAIDFDQQDGSLWRVYAEGTRKVRVHYEVFADNLSGTFSVVDTAHANWNGASMFMYVVGHKGDPARLTITPPPGWHIINGDARIVDQHDFRFPSYDRLIDTPTEVSPHFDVDSFYVNGLLYRVMVHHNGSEQGQRPRFVKDVQKIVTYENTVIGPPPLDMYTFMFHIGYKGRDGMEHLYSTQIIDAEPWSDTAKILPGIEDAAHEYFHVWNVKRIRPAALGPFNYTVEQYEPGLWVAEGWTQYYGEIGLLRAGITDKSTYYQTLGRVIAVNNDTPGRKYVSARQSSFLAPFWDGAATPMQVDRRGSYISYYVKGDALALLLDLEIRSRSNGARSLDDALKALKTLTWDAPTVSYYLQGRGYTERDVEQAVREAAGVDMSDWFDKYVDGVADLPFTETLALAGLTLTTRNVGGEQEYVVQENPNATPQQLRVREGWLAGTTTAAPAKH